MALEQCTGQIHWRQAHGILLKGENGYSGICQVCRQEVLRKRTPTVGQRCANMVERSPWACQSGSWPPHQIAGSACGRPTKEGNRFCDEHLPVRLKEARDKVAYFENALGVARQELASILAEAPS